MAPVILQGPDLRLEPQTLEHSDALHAVTDVEILSLHPYFPVDRSREAFYAFIKKRLTTPGMHPFTMFLRATGQAVGSSTFMDVRSADRGLEIGGTWVGQEFQGTHVNPESKYLMLCHAFETLGAVRVQLKTDARNIQSQRAIEKLGAVREGVLRKHVITSSGYIRDSVMYSIIAEEWPEIKNRLELRLGWS